MKKFLLGLAIVADFCTVASFVIFLLERLA